MIPSRRYPATIAIICIAFAVFSGACRRSADDTTAPPLSPNPEYIAENAFTESVHLPFGILGGEAGGDRQIVVGRGSVFSYSNERGTIEWIAWRTTRSDLGPSISRPDFTPDSRLPGNFRKIGYYDYSGSGYDRGHMVPSADRFADPSLNRETFMMTNIVPQTGALNQYPWEKLESYVRSLARRRVGFDVYQMAGVYGSREVIKGKLTAPTNCWKVIVLVPRGRAPEVTRQSRIIAVDMPNTDDIEREPWESYRTTVREIEQRTGLDLFANLPRDLQDEVEQKLETKNPQ